MKNSAIIPNFQLAMVSLNDEHLKACQAALPSSGYENVANLELEWLLSKGATGPSLNDAWHSYLDSQIVRMVN